MTQTTDTQHTPLDPVQLQSPPTVMHTVTKAEFGSDAQSWLYRIDLTRAPVSVEVVDDNGNIVAVLQRFLSYAVPAHGAAMWKQVAARFPDLDHYDGGFKRRWPDAEPSIPAAEALVAYALTGGPLDRLVAGVRPLDADPNNGGITDRQMRLIMLDLSWRLTEALFNLDIRPEHFQGVVIDRYRPRWRWGTLSRAKPTPLTPQDHATTPLVLFEPILWQKPKDNHLIGLHPETLPATRVYESGQAILEAVIADQTPRLITFGSKPWMVLAPAAGLAESLWAAAELYDNARLLYREVSLTEADEIDRAFPGGFGHRDEANALTLSGFRNGPIEDLHAGLPGCWIEEDGLRKLRPEALDPIAHHARDTLARLLALRESDFARYRTLLADTAATSCRGWDRLAPSLLPAGIGHHGLV